MNASFDTSTLMSAADKESDSETTADKSADVSWEQSSAASETSGRTSSANIVHYTLDSYEFNED